MGIWNMRNVFEFRKTSAALCMNVHLQGIKRFPQSRHREWELLSACNQRVASQIIVL